MAGLDMNNILAAIQGMNAPEIADVPENPTIMDRAQDFLNPNTIRAFGDLATGMENQSFGAAAGSAASANERRKAAQRAGSQASTQDQNIIAGIIKALQDGTLLSSKEENNAFDNLSMDGDGGVTLSMKTAAPKRKLPTTLSDEPLETQLGGADLPGF